MEFEVLYVFAKMRLFYGLRWLNWVTNNEQESIEASQGFLSGLQNRFEHTVGKKNKIADWLPLQSSWFPLMVSFSALTVE